MATVDKYVHAPVDNKLSLPRIPERVPTTHDEIVVGPSLPRKTNHFLVRTTTGQNMKKVYRGS